MQQRHNKTIPIARFLKYTGYILPIFFLSVSLAHAATGTISSAHKYAWSNVGGWVNFAPTTAGVTVTDSVLTGYAWSSSTGWINFAPTQGGVLNDGSGNLSGFAWDESEGWLGFTGVTINSSGVFHGVATGANESINFDCTACDVQTDWRPASSVVTTTPTSTVVPSGSISPISIPPLPVIPSVPPANPSRSNPFGSGIITAITEYFGGSGSSAGSYATSFNNHIEFQSSTTIRGATTTTHSLPSLIQTRTFRSILGGVALLLVLLFVLRFFI